MAQTNDLNTQLLGHINDIEQDPSAPFDEKLFDECSHFLAVQLVQHPEELLQIIIRLSGLLLRAQHDPTPVVRLLTKLVAPLSFSDINSIQPPIDFVAGLGRAALPFNLLVLDLLTKAAETPGDAAVLAGMPNVVSSLVKLWLTTSDMGVADKTLSVLLGLLKVDKEGLLVPVHGIGDQSDQAPASGGQGLIWRRVFGDKDVYGLLFSLTSLASPAGKEISKREKSVAQARLLTALTPLGSLDWSYLTRSHHSEIEAQYGLGPNQGLLHFASLHLVQYKEDVLLHMNLIQFFSDLLSTITLPSISNPLVSNSLDFLRTHGLHDRTMSFWLSPQDPSHDPVDLNFLYGPSANYVAVYAQTYPTDLLSRQTSEILSNILSRLHKALTIPANQWAHGDSPKHDLSVLSAVPRSTLLPTALLGPGPESSPLFRIPSKVTSEDALRTLAKILGGPRSSDGTLQQHREAESQAAPILCQAYLHYHPTLFADIVTHADTVALPGKALAALTLLSSIVSGVWSAGLESASATLALLPPPRPSHVVSSPLSIILRQPARDSVLPYLLRAPRTFSNLVGGRGDTESAAYQIATAKWDCLLLFQRKLGQFVPEAGASAVELGLDALKQAVAVRVAEGVWGSGRQDIGGRIATLEM